VRIFVMALGWSGRVFCRVSWSVSADRAAPLAALVGRAAPLVVLLALGNPDPAPAPDRGAGGRQITRIDDTRPDSATRGERRDAFSRRGSPISGESWELRPYSRRSSALSGKNAELRPYSRRDSRLSIEIGEL